MRVIRRIGCLALLAMLALCAWPAVSASAAPIAALRTYGSCLLGQRTGDLLILIDESGSLKNTDEHGLRADAATHLVNQLAVLANDREIDLSVAVAGFSDVYAPAAPWTSLQDNADGQRAVVKTIDSFRARVNGYETDYWTALDGARRALVDRAQGQPDRCQAIVWFTDGKYNLILRDTDEELEEHGEFKPYAPTLSLADKDNLDLAQAAGEADICRPRGIADQLRARNITMLAVGLNPDEKFDFGVMQKVAEGPPCGQLSEPPGYFWRVSDVNKLIEAFEEMANPNGRPLKRFVVDDALSRVHIYAQGATDRQFVLQGPKRIGSAEVAAYEPQGSGQTKVGSSDVTMSWTWLSPEALVIDLTRDSDSWLGVWSVNDSVGAEVDPNSLRVSFSGDLLPAWPSANENLLVAGDRPEVSLDVARINGDPVDVADIPGEFVFNGSLVLPDGTELPFATGLTKQTIGQPLRLDLSSAPAGPAEIRLDLTYTTAQVDGASTTLDPQSVAVPVTVLPPPDRGRVIPPLDFGTIEGEVDQVATVKVEGPSCVWLGGSGTILTASPDAIDPVQVTSEHRAAATCLQVPAGQTGEFPARLTTGAGGNGSLVGTVEFKIAPVDAPDRAISTAVDFSAELNTPIDPVSFLAGLIAALLFGIGIPAALLYAFKYATAKIPGEWMQAVRVPLQLSDGEIYSAGIPLSGDRLPPAVPVALARNGSRSTSAAGIPLQTSSAGSPFVPGYVRATLAGSAGVSSTDDRPHGADRHARLPLACHNTWALFHDPAGPADHATLLLLQGHDADANRIRGQVDDARRRIPGLIDNLRAASVPPSTPPRGAGSPGPWATTPPPGSDPWGFDASTTSLPSSGTGPSTGDPWGFGPSTTYQPTQPVPPPSASQPPTAQPPTAQPPTDQPPTDQPPTAQPPTDQPPTAQPPTAQPPTAQPPTAQTSATGTPATGSQGDAIDWSAADFNFNLGDDPDRS